MIRMENQNEKPETPKGTNNRNYTKRTVIIAVALAVLLPLITLSTCAIKDTAIKKAEKAYIEEQEMDVYEPTPALAPAPSEKENKQPPETPEIIPQGEDWDGEQNKQTSIDAYIMVPEYEPLFVTQDTPFVWFNNPAQNEGIAYFQYKIMDGDDVIYPMEGEEPVWIEAGKAVKINMKNRLTEGEHDITLCISTCDPTTQEPLNGANLKAHITVGP